MQTFPRGDYSKKQRKKPQTQRKCVHCVTGNDPPPPPAVRDEKQVSSRKDTARAELGSKRRHAKGNAGEEAEEATAKRVAKGGSLWYLNPDEEVGGDSVGFTTLARQKALRASNNTSIVGRMGITKTNRGSTSSDTDVRAFCRVEAVRYRQVQSLRAWFTIRCTKLVPRLAKKQRALSAALARWLAQSKFLEIHEQHHTLQFSDSILPQTRECQRDMFLANELIGLGVSPEAVVSLLYDLGKRSMQAVREYSQKQHEQELYVQKQYRLIGNRGSGPHSTARLADSEQLEEKRNAGGESKNVRVRTRNGEWAWVFAPPRLKSGFFRQSPLYFEIDAAAAHMQQDIEDNEFLELSMKDVSVRMNKSFYKTMEMRRAALLDATAEKTTTSETFHESLFCMLARYSTLNCASASSSSTSSSSSSSSSSVSGGAKKTASDAVGSMHFTDVLGWGYTLHDGVFAVLQDHFKCAFELFASPLDAHYRHFFSAFPDVDGPFGSVGSFFDDKNLAAIQSGCFLAHPPWDAPVIGKAAITRLTSALERSALAEKSLTIVFVMTLPSSEGVAKTVYEASVANWEALVQNEHLADQLVLHPGEHGYRRSNAWQHAVSETHWTSDRMTGVFVLQTPRASAACKVPDTYREAMTSAFAPAEQAIKERHTSHQRSVTRGLSSLGWKLTPSPY
jgi:hypothetical protein